MAVGGQGGPTIRTAIIDPSARYDPLAGSREQVRQLEDAAVVGGSVWRRMENLEVRDGGLQFRPALRRCALASNNLLAFLTGPPRIKALVLDGGRTFVPYIAAYDVSDFTIVSTVKEPAGNPATAIALAQKYLSGTSMNFHAFLSIGGKLFCRVSRSGVETTVHDISSATHGLLDGKRHRFVWGHDSGTTSYVAVDGVTVDTKDLSGTVAPDTQAAALHFNLNTPNGSELGQFALYDAYIDPATAATNFATGASFPATNRVLHMKVDECTGTIAYDSSSNANHGTITGVEGTSFDWAIVPPWQQATITGGQQGATVLATWRVPLFDATTGQSDGFWYFLTDLGLGRFSGLGLADAGSWDTVAAEYAVGTVTWTAGSTTVTGSGTNWATNNVGLGDLILLDNGTTKEWHVVQIRLSASSLSLATKPSTSGTGRSYRIKRGMTGFATLTDTSNGLPPVRWVWHNGDLYVSGILTGLLRAGLVKYTGLDATMSGSVMVARGQMDTSGHDVIDLWWIVGLEALQNGSLVMATVEPGGRNSRFRWSSPADTSIWIASPAGFTDVIEGGSTGTRGLTKLGGLLNMHYADGIALGTPNRQASPPIDWESSRERQGSPSGAAIQRGLGREFFMGLDANLYSHSGGSISLVSDRLRYELEPTLLSRQRSYLDLARQEYGAVVEGGETWAINVQSGEVRKDKYRLTVYLHHTVETMVQRPVLRLATTGPSTTGERDGVGSIVEGYGSDEIPATVDGPGWPGSTITVEAETFPLDLGSPGVRKVIDRVIVWVKNHSGNNDTDTSYSLTVSIVDEGSALIQAVTKTITLPTSQERRHDFEFQPTSSSASWALKLTFGDMKLVGQISAIAIKYATVGEEESA